MINTQGRNRIFSLFITVAVSARRKEIKMCFFFPENAVSTSSNENFGG